MRESDRFADLKRLTEEGLGGLQADDAMWQRVQAAAQKNKQTVFRPKFWIAAAALSAALLLVFGGGRQLIRWQTGSSYQAGSSKNASGSASSVGVSLRNAQTKDEENLLLLGDKAYVLTDPSLSESNLGKKIGSVTEYTLQPSLSDAEIASSVVASGESVYAVKNVPGLVAARVDGKLCAFQRVSALGKTPSGESLADTLCAADQVQEIRYGDRKLEGEAARKAMEKLYANASQVKESLTDGEEITVKLVNGASLYLLAEDDCIAACGTWYCPEFLKCFEN